MTFPSSGVQNEVQAAINMTAAAVATWIAFIPSSFPSPGVSLTNFPLGLQHGALEQNWPDSGLINQFNAIVNQANYTYRI